MWALGESVSAMKLVWIALILAALGGLRGGWSQRCGPIGPVRAGADGSG